MLICLLPQKRVKFPEVYDATELASDELKSKLEPVANRLKDLEKARAERRKVRKRTKASKESAAKPAAPSGDVEMGDASTAAEQQVEEGGELSPEGVYREKEGKELEALVHADLKTDVGCSEHGLYELVAIVTHKGAAANSGHYIGFVKKSVFHGRGSAKPAPSPAEETNGEGSSSTPAPAEAVPSWEAEEDEDWYKFDDDKVSIFPRDKLSTLEGGGSFSPVRESQRSSDTDSSLLRRSGLVGLCFVVQEQVACIVVEHYLEEPTLYSNTFLNCRLSASRLPLCSYSVDRSCIMLCSDTIERNLCNTKPSLCACQCKDMCVLVSVEESRFRRCSGPSLCKYTTTGFFRASSRHGGYRAPESTGGGLAALSQV